MVVVGASSGSAGDKLLRDLPGDPSRPGSVGIGGGGPRRPNKKYDCYPAVIISYVDFANLGNFKLKKLLLDSVL